MSYGMMCLACRLFIQGNGDALECRCANPMPSLDGVREYHPNPLTPSFAALQKMNATTAAAPNIAPLTIDNLRKAIQQFQSMRAPLRYMRMTEAQFEVIAEEGRAAVAQAFNADTLRGTFKPSVYGITILIAGRDEELADCLCRECCHHLAPILPGTSFPIKAGHRWR